MVKPNTDLDDSDVSFPELALGKAIVSCIDAQLQLHHVGATKNQVAVQAVLSLTNWKSLHREVQGQDCLCGSKITQLLVSRVD